VKAKGKGQKAKVVRVLGPAEVEEQNIITAKELQLIWKAIDTLRLIAMRPADRDLAASAKRKIERTLAQMGGSK
jgi:hypothetical protein